MTLSCRSKRSLGDVSTETGAVLLLLLFSVEEVEDAGEKLLLILLGKERNKSTSLNTSKK